jgi:hypothetical protein
VSGNWTGNYAEVGAKIYDAWQQLHAAGKSDLTKARVFEILPRESEISWFSQRPMRPIRTTARRWYRYSQQRSSMFPDFSHAGQPRK